jgi:hypothetical protein
MARAGLVRPCPRQLSPRRSVRIALQFYHILAGGACPARARLASRLWEALPTCHLPQWPSNFIAMHKIHMTRHVYAIANAQRNWDLLENTLICS